MAIRWKQKWARRLATVAAGTALVACGTTPATPGGYVAVSDVKNGGGDIAGADAVADVVVVPLPVVDLVVDANRDGIADPASADDQKYANVFDEKHGASFLANVDDDDGDKVRDADDEDVNGEDDEKDLARIVMPAWPLAPNGAVGKLKLDKIGAENVRLFLKVPDGSWVKLLGQFGPCTGPDDCTVLEDAGLDTDTLRAGAVFGIEGRRFRPNSDDWNGLVTVTLAVTADGKPVVSTTAPNGSDAVQLRVAPWVLHGNTSPFDVVRSANYFAEFVKDLTVAVPAAGLKYTPYSGWNDQWTQDFYQTAWTGMPGPGGAYQFMRIANARPWGRDKGVKNLPYTWLTKNYLKKDQGIIAIYTPEHAGTGSSGDSHGNHDLIPPYVNGDQKYPIGRIIFGSDVLQETHDFYDAQEVQGPSLVIKTDWLYVGHVDEILSYAPAKTPRGWKLLVASDKMAKEMFEKAQKDGHGSVQFWAGKKNYHPTTSKQKDAAVTIDEVLADVDLLQWSQEAGVFTADDLEVVRNEVGLADDEIVQIPFLTEEVSKQGKISWQPGTVNSLVMNDHIAIPNPFGPIIDGADLFAKDLKDRLGTALNALGSDGQGLKLHFIDDWSGYHILAGEVHCGTNPEGPPPTNLKWWEVGR